MVAEYMVHGICGKHNPMFKKMGGVQRIIQKNFMRKQLLMKNDFAVRTTKDLLLKLTSNWIITR
jgi:hypothetical protein